MEYHGIYRGVVVSNDDSIIDQKHVGRLKVQIPSILPAPLAAIRSRNKAQIQAAVPALWASPCFPYGGDLASFYFVPEVGATVWIMFEAGDVQHPVWMGVWHTMKTGGACAIPAEVTTSDKKVIRTKQHLIELDDTVNSENIRITNTKSSAVVTIDKAGLISLVNGNGSVTVKDDGNTEIVKGSVNIKIVGSDVEINASNVKLGGGTMKKLIDERFASLYDAHVHTSAAPGSPTTPPTVLLTPSLSSNATTKTVAS